MGLSSGSASDLGQVVLSLDGFLTYNLVDIIIDPIRGGLRLKSSYT